MSEKQRWSKSSLQVTLDWNMRKGFKHEDNKCGKQQQTTACPHVLHVKHVVVPTVSICQAQCLVHDPAQVDDRCFEACGHAQDSVGQNTQSHVRYALLHSNYVPSSKGRVVTWLRGMVGVDWSMDSQIALLSMAESMTSNDFWTNTSLSPVTFPFV